MDITREIWAKTSYKNFPSWNVLVIIDALIRNTCCGYLVPWKFYLQINFIKKYHLNLGTLHENTEHLIHFHDGVQFYRILFLDYLRVGLVVEAAEL